MTDPWKSKTPYQIYVEQRLAVKNAAISLFIAVDAKGSEAEKAHAISYNSALEDILDRLGIA